MGNLLGSPITDKDTHEGITLDGLPYGISSMQGWRIHMEDAHIAQPFLYAEKKMGSHDHSDIKNTSGGSGGGEGSGTGEGTEVGTEGIVEEEDKMSTTNDNDDGTANPANDDSNKAQSNNATNSASNTTNTSSNTKPTYQRIPLPNHSLFAVFDGHGGSFAAEYASRNLLRVLCRQPAFVAYAERLRDREDYLEKLKLDLLLKRSSASDEEVKKVKEMVRLHLDGKKKEEEVEGFGDSSGADAEEGGAGGDEGGEAPPNNALEVAKASYDHELMTLLEYALRDAFCDVDAEILREVQGDENVDANIPYGYGYLSEGASVGVGHLPAEAGASKPNLNGKSNKDQTMADSSSSAATAISSKPCSHPSHPVNAPAQIPIVENPPVPSEDEDSGTTAALVLLTPRWIVCANAGDSRAVYSRSGHRVVPLSYDHKPDDEEEERRVREAGGYVSGGRVEGDLAVSRGLGDFRFKDLDAVLSGARGENWDRPNTILKSDNAANDNEGQVTRPMLKPGDQKVSPVPDIIVQNRDLNEDEFIIIACDGIWDVQTNQECVNTVSDIFAEGESNLGLLCEEVLDLCLIKGSKDNMTAAVIKFPKQKIGEGGGVTARRERRGESDTADDHQQHNIHLRRVYNPYVTKDMEDDPPNDGEGDTDPMTEYKEKTFGVTLGTSPREEAGDVDDPLAYRGDNDDEEDGKER